MIEIANLLKAAARTFPPGPPQEGVYDGTPYVAFINGCLQLAVFLPIPRCQDCACTVYRRVMVPVAEVMDLANTFGDPPDYDHAVQQLRKQACAVVEPLSLTEDRICATVPG